MKKLIVVLLLLFGSLPMFGKKMDVLKDLGFNPILKTKTEFLKDTVKFKMKMFRDYDTIMALYYKKIVLGQPISVIILTIEKDTIRSISFTYDFDSYTKASAFHKKIAYINEKDIKDKTWTPMDEKISDNTYFTWFILSKYIGTISFDTTDNSINFTIQENDMDKYIKPKGNL